MCFSSLAFFPSPIVKRHVLHHSEHKTLGRLDLLGLDGDQFQEDVLNNVFCVVRRSTNFKASAYMGSCSRS